MKLVHEPVVQRGKIFEAVRAVLFESLEEKYLGARIQLLKEAAELGHAVTAGRNAEYVVDQTFDKLLFHILADKQSVWNLALMRDTRQNETACAAKGADCCGREVTLWLPH